MNHGQFIEKRISVLDIQIGSGLLLCLALTHYVTQIQAHAAATGVIMCMQDSAKFSYKAALTRLLGVAIGGVCGILVVLIDNWLHIPVLFFLLAGCGVIMTLYLCKLANMTYVTAKVSCITFALVILVANGDERIVYAFNRLIGTTVGALIAVSVALVWHILTGRNQSQAAPN